MGRYDNSLFTVPVNLNSELKRRYYDSLLDPVIDRSADDIYVVCTYGERLDLLAWKYYANAELWWIISAANPELRKDSLYLEPGIQVRIPVDYQKVLLLFNEQNTTR